MRFRSLPGVVVALRSTAVLISSVSLLACETTTACDCLPSASVKLVNARMGQGPVDLLVAGESVVSGVPAGTSSAVAFAPSGPQQIVIRSGPTVLAQFSAVLESARLTALALTESGADAFTVPLDTGNTARADRANVRIIAAGSGGSGTLLHVWFNDAAEPTLSLDPGGYFGPYQYFSAGTVRVRFAP